MSPLHCASWKGQKDTVQYLLENGAQVAEADSSLKTALHWTVQFGHYDTLSMLLAVITFTIISVALKFSEKIGAVNSYREIGIRSFKGMFLYSVHNSLGSPEPSPLADVFILIPSRLL